MLLTTTFFICLLFVRALLATILIAAGSAKITDQDGFTATLISLGTPIRRRQYIHGLSLAISCTEILLGLFIISGLWPFLINTILLGMMSSFSIIAAIGLYKTPHTACHCFGVLANSQFSGRGLIHNLLFTAAALIILLSTSSFSFPQSNGYGIVTLLLVAGFLFFALCTIQAAKTAVLLKERGLR